MSSGTCRVCRFYRAGVAGFRSIFETKEKERKEIETVNQDMGLGFGV
jgi:hypothetical protein